MKAKRNPYRKLSNRKLALTYLQHQTKADDARRNLIERAAAAAANDWWTFTLNSIHTLYSAKEIQTLRDRGERKLQLSLPKRMRDKGRIVAKPPSGVCIKCGCTETRACKPPCSWIDWAQTKCSACFPEAVKP